MSVRCWITDERLGQTFPGSILPSLAAERYAKECGGFGEDDGGCAVVVYTRDDEGTKRAFMVTSKKVAHFEYTSELIEF